VQNSCVVIYLFTTPTLELSASPHRQ